jgi:hypothetical protein
VAQQTARDAALVVDDERAVAIEEDCGGSAAVPREAALDCERPQRDAAPSCLDEGSSKRFPPLVRLEAQEQEKQSEP